MTDIRTRLADALREHIGKRHVGSGAIFCTAGPGGLVHATSPTWREWSEHVANALLSLEGVSVVKLPGSTGVNGQDNRVWSIPGFYVEQEFNGDVIINDRFAVCADELPALAAALLAAAAAAEKVSNG